MRGLVVMKPPLQAKERFVVRSATFVVVLLLMR